MICTHLLSHNNSDPVTPSQAKGTGCVYPGERFHALCTTYGILCDGVARDRITLARQCSIFYTLRNTSLCLPESEVFVWERMCSFCTICEPDQDPIHGQCEQRGEWKWTAGNWREASCARTHFAFHVEWPDFSILNFWERCDLVARSAGSWASVPIDSCSSCDGQSFDSM